MKELTAPLLWPCPPPKREMPYSARMDCAGAVPFETVRERDSRIAGTPSPKIDFRERAGDDDVWRVLVASEANLCAFACEQVG